MRIGGVKGGAHARWLAVVAMCAAAASCTTTETKPVKTAATKEYFSEKEYGVKASPRVTTASAKIPRGGGRALVGQPYQVRGKWYFPSEDQDYAKTGLASWYGSAFHGRLTANGEIYDQQFISAAHPTFPLPSYARVTNLENGSSLIVRVNDRGPYHPGRIIDVSGKAAELLDMKQAGTAKVKVEYVGRAPLNGNDMPYMMASYVKKGGRVPQDGFPGNLAGGIMMAANKILPNSLTHSENVPVPTPVPSLKGARLPAAQPSFDATASSLYTQTAYAGPTPTGGYSGDVPVPSAEPTSAFDEFVLLPEEGPIPLARPGGYMAMTTSGSSMVAGYQDESSSKSSEAPFDAVMRSQPGLTPASIVAFYNKTQNADAGN